MRNWLKGIMFECLKEIVKDQPLIIANRPPNSLDVFAVGSMWKNGSDVYIAKKCVTDWAKIE